MVGAADAMLKSTDVQLASYETVGGGLCTSIIRGTVSNVAMAIDAGMHEAERIGELHAVMVIPRLLEDLEHTLPVADYWIDKAEPMPDLATKQESVPQRIALPELEPVSVPVVVDIEQVEEEEKAVEVEIVEPFNPGEGY